MVGLKSSLDRLLMGFLVFLAAAVSVFAGGIGNPEPTMEPSVTESLHKGLQAQRERAGSPHLVPCSALGKHAAGTALSLARSLAEDSVEPPAPRELAKEQVQALSSAIDSYSCALSVGPSPEGVVESLLRKPIASNPRLTHVGVSVCRVTLSSQGAVYVGVILGAEMLPALEEEKINEGHRAFRAKCFLCGETGHSELSAARDSGHSLWIQCPKCRRVYDLYALSEKGSYHPPTWFLRGFLPPGKLEDPLAVWLRVMTTCRYLSDREHFGRADVWQLAEDTYLRRKGDCEDTSILLADWLAALGHDTQVVLGRVRGGRNHAWVVFRDEEKHYILETAGGPKHYRRIPPRAEFLPSQTPPAKRVA